jgi:hypothetical protein
MNRVIFSSPVAEHITPEPTPEPVTPAPVPPAPPGPDVVPPRIDEPTPIENPVPVREPSAPPPPKVATQSRMEMPRQRGRFQRASLKSGAACALFALFAVCAVAQAKTPGSTPNDTPVGTPAEPAEIIGRPVTPTTASPDKPRGVGSLKPKPAASSPRTLPRSKLRSRSQSERGAASGAL